MPRQTQFLGEKMSNDGAGGESNRGSGVVPSSVWHRAVLQRRALGEDLSGIFQKVCQAAKRTFAEGKREPSPASASKINLRTEREALRPFPRLLRG